MGKALADAFPICRETFDEADAALGEPLSRICFEGPEDQLTLTENTQPAILAVSIAAYRLLESRGLTPSFVAGHSLGEYSANVAAGTFAFADALPIVRRRGRYMQEAVPVGHRRDGGDSRPRRGAGGARRAASEDGAGRGRQPGEPERRRAGGDCRHRRAAVARAGERAKALGAKRVVPLPVSAPFHCALMKPAEDRLAPELRALTTQDPASARRRQRRRASRSATRASAIEALVAQVSSPVRWEAVVRRLASEGVTTYVEVGPGTVLSGLVRKIHRDARGRQLRQPRRSARPSKPS